ncbi:MAG: type IV toxin-antitoxin system AbiEi family antitoxin domain-containing protein [Salinibacterium sp.]|nr:type IV toxin-antitoxin system AbiEi family antitoxin domain-containing protein [Salinibacterium sp.]
MPSSPLPVDAVDARLMDFASLEHDGLIFATDLSRIGLGPRAIDRALKRGQLMRLRRGAFVRPELWRLSSPAVQHVLRVTAVTAAARTRPVFARTSAAALWGLPLDEFPAAVVILDRWRGGGRSEPGVVRTARGARTAEVTTRGGFECTTMARTGLDMCRGRHFQQAVPVLDWCLWDRNPLAITKEALAAEASVMKVSPAVWRTVEFATSLSGSIGESEARAVMHLLGFPRPRLQVKFTDAEGNMFPDFYFEEDDAVAEFDGKTKYTRDVYTKGDPAEVLWREKKREDRLRRQVRTVVRILTEDVRNPRLLERKLREGGIRRSAGGSY